MNKVAILFPGQGVQYVGMGKRIYDNYLTARKVFEEASDTLHHDLRKICFEGSSYELAKTESTQPLILTVGVAAFRVLIEHTKIEPEFLAGHSLGEITALVCANNIKFSDAVMLVKLRGKYMQEATPEGLGAMLAVNGIDAAVVKEECDNINVNNNEIVVVSNYNSPYQTVISGYKHSVETVGKLLEREGAQLVRINVSAPFHSFLMKPAAERFYKKLLELSYDRLDYPVVSNITAFPYTNNNFIPDMLASQMIKPVQWTKTMKFLQQQGINIYIDIGPNDVLKNLTKKNVMNVNVFSFDTDEETILELDERAKDEVAMGDYEEAGYTFIERCLAIAVCTPNNCDRYENSEEQIAIYRRMKKLLGEYESDIKNSISTIVQMKQSLDMLCTIFNIKNTPLQEQKNRLRVLFKDTGTTNLFYDYVFTD